MPRLHIPFIYDLTFNFASLEIAQGTVLAKAKIISMIFMNMRDDSM